MSEARRTDISVAREKAILAAVLPHRYNRAAQPQQAGESTGGAGGGMGPRVTLPPDPLDELKSLADTAGAVIVDELIQYRERPIAGTMLGKGKLEDLATLVKAREAEVVIFENDLSPSQIRNIEQVVEVKVLDRSELILDIFANRARTHEAKLQVELAQLEYTYPRLAGMWTHLERIAGGSPQGIGTRGPGEQQIEIDRRIVQRRKAELKREIRRIQQRKRREVDQRNTDFFTVGLVGYTNAGKSTLFNTITGARVYADDKLFATLDTRTRKWELGGGDVVMVSDTVGFVRDLPHHLVASFKATLEESIHSDLLLIVLDASDGQARRHLATVEQVLKEIGAEKAPRLLLLNKIDLLEDNVELLLWQQEHPGALPVSAAQGIGVDRVVEAVREQQRGGNLELTLRVPMAEGKALNFLENRATVHERSYADNSVTLHLTLGRRQLDQLRATGARFEVVEEAAPDVS